MPAQDAPDDSPAASQTLPPHPQSRSCTLDHDVCTHTQVVAPYLNHSSFYPSGLGNALGLAWQEEEIGVRGDDRVGLPLVVGRFLGLDEDEDSPAAAL